jgi:hypothetical protein
MNTALDLKEWIDDASYEELLRRWRFAPSGDPFFIGEMGEYYSRKIAERRKEVGEEEHTRVSKEIGWEKI